MTISLAEEKALDYKPILKNALLDRLPPEWPIDLGPSIQKQVRNSRCKVIIFDDDPTGCQTVSDLPILTEWSVETLKKELANNLTAFFILTNSRSITPKQTRILHTKIGYRLVEAARLAGRRFVIISRSDSTLRGHFYDEMASLSAVFEKPFDSWIVFPFFIEGGRYSINDVHYVDEDDRLIPAGGTIFAKDRVFGYTSSNLHDWVIEKSQGHILPDAICSISIDEIRKKGPQHICTRLMSLKKGSVCVVNAASYRDVEVFTLGMLEAEAQGKRFLCRSAASFVRVRSGAAPKALLTKQHLNLSENSGGLIIVGSYVEKTTDQLNFLLSRYPVAPVEVDIEKLLSNRQCHDEIKRVTLCISRRLKRKKDTVLFTSRSIVDAKNAQGRLSVGQKISQGLAAIVRQLTIRPRYLLAKGGITASDVATSGLNVRRATISGQIIPGVPVWQLGFETKYPGLVYIVFPGNVGNSQALAEVVDILSLK